MTALESQPFPLDTAFGNPKAARGVHDMWVLGKPASRACMILVARFGIWTSFTVEFIPLAPGLALR